MGTLQRRLIVATVINTIIFTTEALSGIFSNSLSLLMDSAHNLSDEMALVFLVLACLLPVRLSLNLQRTANIFNSAGLIIISSVLTWQAINHMLHPHPVSGIVPAIVGMLAAAGNYSVAHLLGPIKDRSTAIRLAYLHNMGDVYVSLAPVIAGILVAITGLPMFDPLVALVIALWIIWSTIREIVVSREQLLWPEDLYSEADLNS